MSKFNTVKTRVAPGKGPVKTEATPSGLTYNGAPGYKRDVFSELFLFAVTNMVGEDTYYESAGDRDNRFRGLVATAVVQDPQWVARLLNWLRSDGNMRSASIVGALEAAKAMIDNKIPGSRAIVASVLQRADEPGEALAYWTSKYGRSIPKPVKRGIADALGRLYTEYNLLKYDTASKGYRFADVLDLVHPSAVAPWQAELFKFALARRHNRDEAPGELLSMIAAQTDLRRQLSTTPKLIPSSEQLKAAGMTWEDTLSALGSKVNKGKLWDAVIPSMGYMALLRNLRNFDEAGISDKSVQLVCDILSNPDAVAKSRQFPYRFLAAYKAAPHLRWGPALDKALTLSLGNLPVMSGRNLVLIDTSGSMQAAMSGKSTMTRVEAAAVFGVALAIKTGADLYGFATGVFQCTLPKGASVINSVSAFCGKVGSVGHGTEIASSLRRTFNGHDRVFLFSDMQTTGAGTGSAVPANVPLYGFNLAGYQHAAYGTNPYRQEMGGLTDATFRMIPLLEAGRDGNWPF